MPKSAPSVTPMMAQYLEIKAEYPDALLFYRMGDFYEMFFDDAVAAADALDIALTKRGKHRGTDVPMCGVPVHASDGYLQTLIRRGFRVAVCEQLETPEQARARGSKSVVKRDVTRLISPGTVTEDSLLVARQHSFLCAFSEIRGDSAIAWTDITTGDFRVQRCPRVSLGPMLARLTPREVLISETIDDALHGVIEEAGASPTVLAPASFDSSSAKSRLLRLFRVASLEGYGDFAKPELSAMGAVVDYLELTQKGNLPRLRPPVSEDGSDSMQIDAATRRNLELTRNLSGERSGSLLASVDRTVTSAGARLLERRLASPSTRVSTIERRLDSVGFFHASPELARTCRKLLRPVPDMGRSLNRLSLRRGGPRDLAAIRDGLHQAELIAAEFPDDGLPAEVSEAVTRLVGHDELRTCLDAALVPDPPFLARDGGFVAPGHDPDLDAAQDLRDGGRRVMSGLQEKYRGLSGVPSLRIRHNNVLGYFVETSSRHAEAMLGDPLSETFMHRQTTANSLRFTTLELSRLEAEILEAAERALEIELRIFDELSGRALEGAESVAETADALAAIDLAASFADLAAEENWVRPSIFSDRRFRVRSGRHPVVEAALRRSGSGSFVANDCDLTGEEGRGCSIWLVTGPNMAGKSTFLRQNALILLLSQTGSFVPAASAEIGVATQLFSRVGASDDLARGRSTFMVEMVETAAILNRADESAFVILDEIGRGTATYDGLSIAWATLEYLHEVKRCRSMFATHYHELTALEAKLGNLSNATVAVREWKGEIVFLHEVRPGSADRSYGVQVARLAGLPESVIERATSVLNALENGEQAGGDRVEAVLDGLPLFENVTSATPSTPDIDRSPVIRKLRDVHPDDFTPRDALDLVYELKALLDR